MTDTLVFKITDSAGNVGTVTQSIAVSAPTGTGTGSGTTTPASTIPDPGGFTNPFLPALARTPIPANPTLSPNSATYVATLQAAEKNNYGTWGLNGWGSCPTRYIVNAPGQPTTPTVPVKITGNGGSWVGTVMIPIPPDAIPDPNGEDHEIVIWDVAAGKDWELWGSAKSSAGVWTALTYAVQSTVTGSGVFSRSNPVQAGANTVAASGLAHLALDVTVREVQAGVIDHALFLAAPCTNGQFVAPALSADGNTKGGVPEGTRFFFPASAQMPSGLCPLGQMLFLAGKTYGFYLADTSPAVVVTLENAAAWTSGGGSDPWAPFMNNIASYTIMGNFPWSTLQVLAVP